MTASTMSHMETVLESPIMMNEPSIPFNGSETVILTGRTEPEGERAAHAPSPHATDRPPTNSPAPNVTGRSGTQSPSLPGPFNQSTLGAGPSSGGDSEIDPAILEALRSPKERLFVLKLADAMESLINERGAGKPNPRTSFQPTSSYQRLLVHRCSAYYKLTPEAEQATKAIIVIVNLESRIPPRRISELVPAESTSSQPTFKIMRRTTPDQRTKNRTITTSSSTPAIVHSDSPQIEPTFSFTTASVASATETPPLPPDGVDTDDPDAAILKELGLLPHKARSVPGTTTPRKTIEEREAAYQEAKRRIFSDFPEKEREAARLREDREREREVRDLHRELAAEEEERGSAGDATGSVSQPYANGPNGSIDLQSSATDLSAPAVYYPSLYDPSVSNEAGNTNVERGAPVQSGHDQQPYPHQPVFDQTHGHYTSSYPLGPYAAGHYPPYPASVNGMHMAGPQQQVMGPYAAYPGQPPMQMGVIPMISYPYYPPPQSWGDPSGGYHPPASGMDSPMGQNGYAMYAIPMQQQPPPLWAPAPLPHQRQHQPARQPNDAPHQSNQPHPQQIHANAPSFVPSHGSLSPAPYFNPNAQQQPYPPQQQMRPPPPPHAQSYTFSPPQGPSSQRQLWNPNNTSGNMLNNNGRKDMQGQGRNGTQGIGQQQQRAGANSRGMPPPSFTPSASISPSSSPVKLGLTPSRSSSNRNGVRDFGKTTTIATPMTLGPVGPSTRSRNSSISSTSAMSALGIGDRMWGSGVLGGMSPVSPNGRAGSMSNLSSPDPGLVGDVIGMSGRMSLGRSLGARRGSGSVAGSMGSGSNGGESGTRTPLDETASVSSSISSASSSRTFTSTSSKHPSLPSRPDWSMGPMGLLHATSSRASISSQSSTRANPRSASSNNSNPAHSRSHSSQSHPQTSSFPILQSTDFPPLPGAPSPGQGITAQRPLMTLVPQDTAWGEGGRLNLLMSGGSSGHLQNGMNGVTLPNPMYMNGDGYGPHVNQPPQVKTEIPNGKQAGRASTPVGVPRSSSVTFDHGELVNGSLSGEMARLDVTDETQVVAQP
ncbi:hypothetical protein FRB94_006552 [Tulasnella sp. JGI-2019a]|nr:hypothetical protein FRB94_006552 [Tulasnella sp. JGI-2019a]